MRRLPLCFFLIAFSAPFAFADGTSTTVSRVIPSAASNTSSTSQNSSRGTSSTVSRAQTSRTTTAAQTSVPQASSTSSTTDTSSRDSEARNVVSRTASSAATATQDSNVVRVGSRVLNLGGESSTTSTATSRGSTTTVSSGVSRAGTAQTSSNSARDNLEATVNTVGRNARVEAASINNNPAVRRAGLTLRPSTAEVGGRATIAGTTVQTGSNIDEEVRGVQSRAATTTPTTESITEAKDRLDLTADLNTSCQQQYNDCMDQFCSVIDSNQKRCSCSANLNNYTRVEEAVTDANNQLNEVAQRIRYVGLSADEIRAIMTETEAEEALSGAKDTSETRNMLDEIEALIRDPSSASSTSSYNSSAFGLDMDLDFSSDTADIFSLDFLNTGTTSMSNLRGRDLYNAAKSRCKTILNQCEAAGANVEQITANYDLAIDKDCISYEQGLTKMNETLVSNVRSANLMLQKARLAVLQNKNQYDAKGCIAALDTCMTDEMVCGADYTKCLDPTKKYIDENGEVVLGQNITKITDFMTAYNNANITSDFLKNSYTMSINEDSCSAAIRQGDDDATGNNGACVVSYLLKKIGTKQEVTDEGLCRAVLDKCQAYTYDDNGNYQPYNDVVTNYIQRAMVNIKAQQQQIISDYASNCMLDIATCYNQQVTQVNAWSSSASINGIYNVMRGACRNVALTCAYAVFDKDTTSCPENDDNKCINSISEMFYQSLLCPDNSTYAPAENVTVGSDGYVNERCKCLSGYKVSGTQCVAISCPENASVNSSGVCECDSGYKLTDGKCVAVSCQINAHFDASAGKCVCDTGYQLNTFNLCEAIICGDNQHIDSAENKCKCNTGWLAKSGRYGELICCPAENHKIDLANSTCSCLDNFVLEGSTCVPE